MVLIAWRFVYELRKKAVEVGVLGAFYLSLYHGCLDGIWIHKGLDACLRGVVWLEVT
jgi:hypothetical protein